MFKKILAIGLMLMIGITGINISYSATVKGDDFRIPSDADGIRPGNTDLVGVDYKRSGYAATGQKVSAYAGDMPMLLYGVVFSTMYTLGTDAITFKDSSIQLDIASTNTVCSIFISTAGMYSDQTSINNIVTLPYPIKFRNGIQFTNSVATFEATILFRYLKR